MRNSFKVRKRNSFNAALVILILNAFSYANDWQSPGITAAWICIGVFFFAFAFRKSDEPKERRNAIARRAFYRQYFGPVAPAAPLIPYALLIAAYAVMNAFPRLRWLVWTLLGVAAVYASAFLFLMSRFLRHWRRELRNHAPEYKEPWDGADGVI